jgi:hypothetical protein
MDSVSPSEQEKFWGWVVAKFGCMKYASFLSFKEKKP